MSLSSAKILAAGLGFALALLAGSAAQEKSAAPAGQAIEITIPRRFEPVDFAREVLPILKKNCLACHNKTTAKEDLILETPADMLKGGESGPAIVPEHGEQSLMFKMAAHQKRPFMPPHENKVAATDLTPEQLGLIKLWIDQGAKNSVATNPPVVWQKMPAALNPIFAVAITGNGEFAACARANQISVYHLPTREIVAQMADPQLGSLYPDSPPAHRDLVESLAFNPEGNLLASGSFREVKLWRRPVNPRVRSWPTLAQRPITAATASSDGKWLVAGDDRGRVVVTSLENPKQSRAFDAHKGLTTGLAFSADGARLVSISADKGVAVWSVSEGRRLALGTAASALNAVTWLPDQRLATAGADGAIRLWQLPASPGKSAPLQEVASFHAHDGAVTALAFSGQLVSGGTDGNVVFWNLEKQEPSKKLAFGSQVACVAAQANGKRVAAAGTNGTTKLWSVPKGDLIAEFKGDWRLREASESKSREVEFQKGEVAYFQGQLDLREKEHKDALERLKKAAEGRSAAEKTLTEKQAVAREAEEAKIKTEQAMADYEAQQKTVMETLASFEKSAVATGDPKSKLPGDFKAAREKLNVPAGELRKRLTDKVGPAKKKLEVAQAEVKKAEQGKLNAEEEANLAGPAAERAAESVQTARSARDEATSRLAKFNAALAESRQAADASKQAVLAIAFSPDGRLFATAGADRVVHTWNAENGAACETYSGHSTPVTALCFTSARQLVSTGDRGAIAWDLDPVWKLERVLGAGDPTALADRINAVRFSPDGKWLATGGGEPTRGGEIKLWEVATGKLVNDFKNVHSDAVFGLDFSPDGKFLASAAADKFIRVTELATGKVVKAFEGHTHHVLGVSWKHDGRTLVSAGADNLIKVWDFVSGERRKNIEGFTKEVTAVGFVGFTDQAIAASGDRQVKLIRDNGETVRSLNGETDFVNAAGVTADGKIVVAGGQDGVLHVWNGASGESVATFGPQP